MTAKEGEKKAETQGEEKGGELLFCGATSWETIGKSKRSSEGNLVSPTRLRALVGVDIRFVASGCCKFFNNHLHFIKKKTFFLLEN